MNDDRPTDLEWERLGRRTVHSSWWMEVHLDRMRLNDGRIIEHEVVVSPQDAAGVAVVDADRGVLMIYRHRFITDVWAWELPAGLVEIGEDTEAAAARECLEETGYEPGPLRHLTTWHPSSGYTDQTFHLYLADGAEEHGPPSEKNEAITVAWRSFDEVADDLAAGRVPDGFTQMGLVWAFVATGRTELLTP